MNSCSLKAILLRKFQMHTTSVAVAVSQMEHVYVYASEEDNGGPEHPTLPPCPTVWH